MTQGPLNIENSSFYTVNFSTRADSARTIYVFIGQYVYPWDVYSNYDMFNLTTSMQNFTFTFQMIDPTDTAAELELNFGMSDIDVYVDNITMSKN